VTILRVKVKPNSREAALVRQADGSWLARLKSPPVDGKANAELISLVAEQLGVAKAAVEIKAGATGRMKILKIALALLMLAGCGKPKLVEGKYTAKMTLAEQVEGRTPCPDFKDKKELTVRFELLPLDDKWLLIDEQRREFTGVDDGSNGVALERDERTYFVGYLADGKAMVHYYPDGGHLMAAGCLTRYAGAAVHD
jgi:uncharacterized protein